MGGVPDRVLLIDPASASLDYDSRESRGFVTPPFAVRLDAVAARRALSGLPGPRSFEFHEVLTESARVVADLLGARAVHVVSDEANLVFVDYVPYSGREFKIISVAAGALSSEVSLRLGRRVFFDARVVRLFNCEDAVRYILYRARVGLGNYVQELARRRGIIPRDRTPPLQTYIHLVEFDAELGAGTVYVKQRVGGRWRGWRRVGFDELAPGLLCPDERSVDSPGDSPGNPDLVGH